MNQTPGTKIFVDGQAGTTALQVFDFLENRSDIEVIRLPDDLRKEDSARQDAIGESDLTILCLPDDAARQSVEWAQAHETRVIDASTAHRVSDEWIFGMPELGSDVRQSIQISAKVANPGCYPTGAILLLRPLIDEGLLAADSQLIIHALSGYSGGGTKFDRNLGESSTGTAVHTVFSALCLRPGTQTHSGNDEVLRLAARTTVFAAGRAVFQGHASRDSLACRLAERCNCRP